MNIGLAILLFAAISGQPIQNADATSLLKVTNDNVGVSRLSAVQWRKLIAILHEKGKDEPINSPSAFYLGWTKVADQNITALTISTKDQHYAFSQSNLDHNDIAFLAREDSGGGYLFSTHSDLRIVGCVYLSPGHDPTVMDVRRPELIRIFRQAVSRFAEALDRMPDR